MIITSYDKPLRSTVAFAEWLRRLPAKHMGFPRECSNLSDDVLDIFLQLNFDSLLSFLRFYDYFLQSVRCFPQTRTY